MGPLIKSTLSWFPVWCKLLPCWRPLPSTGDVTLSLPAVYDLNTACLPPQPSIICNVSVCRTRLNCLKYVSLLWDKHCHLSVVGAEEVTPWQTATFPERRREGGGVERGETHIRPELQTQVSLSQHNVFKWTENFILPKHDGVTLAVFKCNVFLF